LHVGACDHLRVPTTSRALPDEDILGAPYTCETLQLRPDDEGDVVATLVHRPTARTRRRAVLHVHGFADYFFQTAAADFWVARGYDFYALDLRKYGRSIRPHQTPNYVADLGSYYEELDIAWERVHEHHDEVVLSAHSTGGLTVPLWLHDRQLSPAGVFLNAPWLDWRGDDLTQVLALPVIERLGRVAPMREVPRDRSGGYARSISNDFNGEWPVNLEWRPEHSWPVYAGWVRAIRRGQARVAARLEVGAPVLMVSSSRRSHPTVDADPDFHSSDTVLDVDRMRRKAVRLSRHVTVAQVDGAIHDVTLSPEPARSRVFDEIGRWLSAYVEG
jgi:alpha-beta hydrolase superfamily lysophospholipase